MTCQSNCRDVDDRTFRRWARSSAVEHCLDMAGVTGSIPVAPTIAAPQSLDPISIPSTPTNSCVSRAASRGRASPTPPTILPRRCGWPARATRPVPRSWCSPSSDCRPTRSRTCCCRTRCSTQVEASIAEVVAASNKLFPVLVVGAPLRVADRLYNTAVVIHRGVILGVVPKTYLPNYREFYEKRHFVSGANVVERHDRARRPGRAVRHRPAVPVDRLGRRHLPCRDLRGHLGAGAAVEPRGARRRRGAAQPVGQQHHHRQGRDAAAAVRQPVGARASRPTPTRRPAPANRPPTSPGTATPRSTRCGDQLAESARFEKDSTIVTRRRRSRPHPPGAPAQRRLRRLRACRRPTGSRASARSTSRSTRRAESVALERAGRALSLRAVRSRQAARQLLRGLQHPGPGPGAAPAVEPAPSRRSSASRAASIRPRR